MAVLARGRGADDRLRALLPIAEAADLLFPIALFALAVVGTLWSDASWGARLLRHRPFRQAPGAAGAVLSFRAFGARHVGVHRFPGFVHAADGDVLDRRVLSRPYRSSPGRAERGIFVKNYIDQSQEFALCAVALAYPVITLLRSEEDLAGVVLVAVSLSFIVNMVVRHRVANGDGHDAGHARGVCDAAPEMANQRRCSSCAIGRHGGAWPGRRRRNCSRRRNAFVRNTSSTRNATCRRRSDCGWNSGRSRCGSLRRRRSSDTAPVRRAGCSRGRPPVMRDGHARSSATRITRH